MSANGTNMAGCYRSNDNIVTRVIADETWLIPITGQLADLEQIYSLNDVGAFIWQQLDGKNNIESIHQSIIDAYDVPATDAREDLLAQLQEFIDAGLVDPVTQ